MFSKKRTICLLLLFLVLFTRFIKLDWGNGFFFHPDENNMAAAVSRLSPSSFDPHFYAYGQFPLYLAYFSGIVVNIISRHTPPLVVNFETAALILRFYSALFSVIAILFAYYIGHFLFKKNISVYLFILLLIFSPGLIQLAHFGTTESLLIMVFLALIYFSLKLVRHLSLKTVLFASLFSAVGLASKTSALIFISPVFFALFFRFIQKPALKPIFVGLIFILAAILLTVLLSPYSVINYKDFISTMAYETEVAVGKMTVFYTNQFKDTIPYLYQLIKIFPYSSGIILYILSISGLVAYLLNLPSQIRSNKLVTIYWSLVAIPSLVYFAYFGQVYTKWFRFMSPLFFLQALFAAYLITNVKNQAVKIFLVLFSIIPGILFLTQYYQPDIRIQFSRWFSANIPPGSKVLSEAGNVINIPLTDTTYNINNFDFYGLDNNLELQKNLVESIESSDYILIPSRRIFANQSNSDFPVSQSYYYNLFMGNLGFIQVATFSLNNNLFLNDEKAEETFSVFDHPVIRLYRKTKYKTNQEITNLLSVQ